MREGFIKGRPARGGFSIWLPEDAGNDPGRSIPSNSSTVTKAGEQNKSKSQLVKPAKQTEGNEVKLAVPKVGTTVEPQYVFERLQHPETGEVGVLDIIRYIMKYLDGQLPNNPKMDGGYSLVKMQIYDALGGAGIPPGSRPELSRIMQEMGLIKRYSKSKWGVLVDQASEYFITRASYDVAKAAMLVRRKRNQKLARLEQKLTMLENGNADKAEVSKEGTPSFKEHAVKALKEAKRFADALAEAKTSISILTLERDQLTKEVVVLKKQLAERPTSDDSMAKAMDNLLAELKNT